MTVMRFVDTNIPIYAVSPHPDETEKQRIAEELLCREAGRLAISVQVLGEFYAQVTRPTRLGALSHRDAVAVIEKLQRLQVQAITPETVNLALSYRTRFSLSYWDCLILASAKLSGCEVLYSEDMSDGQNYDGVRVINPFVADC